MAKNGERIVNMTKKKLSDSKLIKGLQDQVSGLTNENEELETKYNNEHDKYNGLLSFLSDYLFNKTNNVFKYENAIKEQISMLMVANAEPLDNVSLSGGYISNVQRVSVLIRPTDIPEDIANGYWQLVDGKYILDKDKYNQMWSVI